MTSIYRLTPATFIAIIMCILRFGISGCDGLKKPRNFAHVYGKRASPEAYNFKIGGHKSSKLPMFSGGFPNEYAPTDENFLLRREDAKVNAKANVGHMFGRDLYDSYPLYDVDNMYTIPELEEDNIIEVPNVNDNELFNIPPVQADGPQDRIERKRY